MYKTIHGTYPQVRINIAMHQTPMVILQNLDCTAHVIWPMRKELSLSMNFKGRKTLRLNFSS